jgi:hypothetical protein
MTQVQLGYNTITAEKLGYGDRKYYLNITGDADAALPIYMLDLSSGHSVSWTVLASDSAGNILPSSGVLVTARRNLGGWKTIDQETTDDSGTASLWLDYESYEMTFSKAGCTNVTKTITATESSYQQSLSCAVISNLTFDYEFRDITFNITPDAFYTNTTNIIFEIKSWNSTLQYYGFNVTWNGTVIYSGYGTSITGGILNATVNLTNATGTFVKMDIWFKTGNFTEMKFTLYRAVGNPYTVGGAESWLRNIANYLGLPARMIVALFLSILLIAGFGRYSGFGAGIIVLIFLGILTFVGWFEGFPMWLPTYTVFIMATFGIYMLRGER